MSGEEYNRELFKETFEEIPIPEGLAEKVGSITVGNTKRQRTVMGSVPRKVAIAAAILVALFAGSNGIAYAMTGETWVETMILRRDIDGIEYEIEAEKRELRNGETVYIGEIELENGERHGAVEYDGEGPYMYIEFKDEGAAIWSNNGKTYIWDGDLELDISEDFADDGDAKGTYVVNGVFKRYFIYRNEEGEIVSSIYTPPQALWPENMR
ncbi:MAG: hypothetical protein IKB07_01080 [Lachnospiraceae bacterium]|nr:hypothetical protein [Lachnospiraceae bacterium]